MKIREAGEADFNQLLELSHKFFISEKKFEPSFSLEWPKSKEYEEFILDCLKEKDKVIYICESDGKVVGFLIGWIRKKIKNSAYIDSLFIEDNYRRKGLATNLLNEFTDWVRGFGANKIFVGSFVKNQKAMNLYRNLGYKEDTVFLKKEIK